MVHSWSIAGCNGVIGVATCTMGVTVGRDIGIGLLLYNSGSVALCQRNGSVGHEACYFCCNRYGKLWVGAGRRIGLIVSFFNVTPMVS